MKKNISRAKVGSVISSAVKNQDGLPVWCVARNGSITIRAVNMEMLPPAAV
ncbi:hypothetical protein [Pseudomonas syringae]|uniref:hypothetical protein n=1 Tax=Pseudomonas syringae TaxID=317 RepID=UPI00129B19B9|nr:hypothetical protein [Pseudomonas syringae]QGG75837.1 hypothetical protein N028_10895 [Pseudomonas syringae USA011]